MTQKTGSSPRVWGQADGLKPVFNIPEDHPHACGDKIHFAVLLVACMGSSPRVWGQGQRGKPP